MAKTTGTWQFKSEKDSRWNCGGTYVVRTNIDHPREALEKFVELQMSLGDPPDDITQLYVSSGIAK